MNNKIIDDMKAFCARFKLSTIEGDSCPLTLGEVVQFQSDGLRGKTTEEIEDFIFKTHAYVTILKNKKSSMGAFCTGLNSLINKYVNNNLESVDKFLPYNAKRDAIISTDATVMGLDAQLVSAKMQLEKIGNIPEGIDSTLRSLENYLRRRHSN